MDNTSTIIFEAFEFTHIFNHDSLRLFSLSCNISGKEPGEGRQGLERAVEERQKRDMCEQETDS